MSPGLQDKCLQHLIIAQHWSGGGDQQLLLSQQQRRLPLPGGYRVGVTDMDKLHS